MKTMAMDAPKITEVIKKNAGRGKSKPKPKKKKLPFKAGDQAAALAKPIRGASGGF